MNTAAVALLHGWADPMGLLALPTEDYEVAVAVVNRAARLGAERRGDEIRLLAKAVGAEVSGAVANLLRAVMR